MTSVKIEHSSVTCRIRSSGFDVFIVAVRIVSSVPGDTTAALSPAAVALLAGVPVPAETAMAANANAPIAAAATTARTNVRPRKRKLPLIELDLPRSVTEQGGGANVPPESRTREEPETCGG